MPAHLYLVGIAGMHAHVARSGGQIQMDGAGYRQGALERAFRGRLPPAMRADKGGL